MLFAFNNMRTKINWRLLTLHNIYNSIKRFDKFIHEPDSRFVDCSRSILIENYTINYPLYNESD